MGTFGDKRGQKDTERSMYRFSEFIRMLHGHIGQKKSQPDYMQFLFTLVMCDPYTEEDISKEENDEYYPFSRKSQRSIAKKIYTGDRSLPVAIARFVRSHYAQDGLILHIENLSDEEHSSLCRDLSEKGIECDVSHVADVISNLFQRFLDAAINENDAIELETRAAAPVTIQDREATNHDALLLGEVGNICPLCGRQLMRRKGDNVICKYKVVQIFPENIPQKMFDAFDRICPTNGKYDSDENHMALCTLCALDYEADPTLEVFEQLEKIKRTLVQQNVLHQSLENIDLEEEISHIIIGLIDMTVEAGLVPLNMSALRVEQKIHKENRLLINSISDDVVRYYKFIEEQFRDADSRVSNTFERVASEVKLAYEKLEGTDLAQEQVYEELIAWTMRKLQYSERHRLAARIVISFFVQNCEVFHEVSK